MTTTEIFLPAMIIIFALPYAFWRVLRTDYYAPLVVVQITGGILLGPGILGTAFPEYYAFIFTPQVIGALNGRHHQQRGLQRGAAHGARKHHAYNPDGRTQAYQSEDLKVSHQELAYPPEKKRSPL